MTDCDDGANLDANTLLELELEVAGNHDTFEGRNDLEGLIVGNVEVTRDHRNSDLNLLESEFVSNADTRASREGNVREDIGRGSVRGPAFGLELIGILVITSVAANVPEEHGEVGTSGELNTDRKSVV